MGKTPHPATSGYLYESLEELPEFTDYSMKGRTYRYMEGKAQFPFGYGLTYSNVKVENAEVRQCGRKITVEAEVYNKGNADTEEVVQVYVKNLDSKNANSKSCNWEDSREIL